MSLLQPEEPAAAPQGGQADRSGGDGNAAEVVLTESGEPSGATTGPGRLGPAPEGQSFEEMLPAATETAASATGDTNADAADLARSLPPAPKVERGDADEDLDDQDEFMKKIAQEYEARQRREAEERSSSFLTLRERLATIGDREDEWQGASGTEEEFLAAMGFGDR